MRKVAAIVGSPALPRSHFAAGQQTHSRGSTCSNSSALGLTLGPAQQPPSADELELLVNWFDLQPEPDAVSIDEATAALRSHRAASGSTFKLTLGLGRIADVGALASSRWSPMQRGSGPSAQWRRPHRPVQVGEKLWSAAHLAATTPC